jgi:hypothetical protein
MTTKKIKIVRDEPDYHEVKPAQAADVAVTKKNNSLWEGKTGEELAREQGITPVKDEKDFASRFLGGGEDWDDMDEFLKYFHSH